MSGNEIDSSDQEKSPSPVISSNDQGRRIKEVSLKMGEPLKKHLKRKRPESRSKSSSDRSTDEERGSSPKRRSKKSKKGNQSQSKKKTKRKIIGDIHLHHHHQAHLMTILMRVKIEAMIVKKVKIEE